MLHLGTPDQKMGLFRQMIGRVLRPAPGKTDAIILDHSGAVYRHGFAEDHVEWTLDPDHRAESAVHAARCEFGSSSRLLECSQCSAIRIAGERCPCCGFLPKPPARAVSFVDGDLGLVKSGRSAQAAAYDPVERSSWYAMLTAIEAQRQYKTGWARVNYWKKFGVWPSARSIAPMEPTPEVLAWVRAKMIAFAKSRQAAS
jgi:hypothetical protein